MAPVIYIRTVCAKLTRAWRAERHVVSENVLPRTAPPADPTHHWYKNMLNVREDQEGVLLQLGL